MRIKKTVRALCLATLLLSTTWACANDDVTLENVVSPAPNLSDEPLADEYSLGKAVRFLDSAVLTWQKERNCFACHSNYVYLMAKPVIDYDNTAHRQIRDAAEYLATHPRSTYYQATESVMIASVLAQNDAATTGTLHPATRTALDKMWEFQRDDGGWDWLCENKPPSEIADHYGVAMAAIGVGAAPEDYDQTPAAVEGLENIREYFRTHPPVNVHERSMEMLASLAVDGLMDESERDEVVEELLSLQKTDGGWNLATLGTNWERSDGTPQDYDTSDGYGTGFVIYALRSAGVPAEDPRIQKGIQWLKTNQRVSGRWFTRSMEADSRHYVTHSGTAYALLAIAACGETASAPSEEIEPDWIISQKETNSWSILNTETGTTSQSSDPIHDVFGADRWSSSSRNRLPMKSPGDTIVLRSGEYPHSRITLTYDLNDGVAHGLRNDDRIKPNEVSWGRDPMTVIRAEEPGTVLFRRNPVGGSQTLYFEWAGAVRLEGLAFQGSSPMGIGTENPKLSQGEWQGFRDIELVNCSVRGERDFETNEGPRNKWAMLTYALGRSARGDNMPGFLWSGGATPDVEDDWDIEGIHLEHAMYHHNVIANNPDAFAMLIENLRIRWCGRTAFQMVARTGEGADGQGMVVLRNLEIEDVCLEEGGGGSALTFAGNHNGDVLIEDVTIKLGANPLLHEAYSPNITGSLVAYAGGGSEGRPTREIVVKDCHFQVGPHFVGEGPARRTNVNVSDVGRFSLLNTTILSCEGASAALSIDPKSVGHVTLDASNRVIGDCHWGEREFLDPQYDGSGYAKMIKAIQDDPQVEVLQDASVLP